VRGCNVAERRDGLGEAAFVRTEGDSAGGNDLTLDSMGMIAVAHTEW
jgi:hypothetical protein